jgi:hypothetical protein
MRNARISDQLTTDHGFNSLDSAPAVANPIETQTIANSMAVASLASMAVRSRISTQSPANSIAWSTQSRLFFFRSDPAPSGDDRRAFSWLSDSETSRLRFTRMPLQGSEEETNVSCQ